MRGVKSQRISETRCPPDLQMRSMRFDEVPEVLRLVERAVERGCRNHYDPRQRAAVCAAYAGALFVEALGPFETVVVEQQGRVIAIAQLDPSHDRLRALFVDAGCQQRGVGRALLSDIEDRARRRRRTRLDGAMALNAVGFYLRAGFLPCGGPEHLGSASVSVPVQRMEKHLRGKPERGD
jgi:GNAT superfamily N-acetyltransferase